MNLKQVLAAGCMAFALLCAHAIAYAAPAETGGAAALEQGKIRVSGTIVDNEGNPVPGAAVLLKDAVPPVGTVTDLDGNFWMEVPSKSSVLVVQVIGFSEQEFQVGNKINFSIQLEPEATELNEVVVSAYGTQKRGTIVSAIETVEPTHIQVGSTRSLSNNLAGNIAGVIAVQRSGEPGYDNSNFWIRGVSTFSGATNPLVLVDGIERDLNNIDPAEIESFSVLKDASATAMYGVRGANGVIIINTKRGQVGKPTVNFRLEQSVSQPTQLPEFASAADYMELLNELKVDKNQLPYTQKQIDLTRAGYDKDLYPDTQWIEQMTKDYAYSTRGNLSVSGGSDFLRYSLVASMFRESGITERDYSLPYDTSIKLQRYNVRANVDLDITKTTLFRLNVGGYMQKRRGPNTSIDDVLALAFETAPMVHPHRYSDGTIPVFPQRANPWANLTQTGYQMNHSSQIQALLSLEQNLRFITQGLKAKVTFSFDSSADGSVKRATSPTLYGLATGRDEEGNLIGANVYQTGSESLGHEVSGGYGNKRTYFEANLTYDRTFKKHNVNGLLLYNQQSYDDGAIQPYRKQGIAGRASYVYDNKYVAEVNFGYNGSENFAPGQRFGLFPSFALGWRISDEPWMQWASKTMNKLKVRASYGKVGNDSISGRRFAYITTVWTGQDAYYWGENSQYGFGGITEGDPGVTGLTWETAWKKDIGFELGLWNALDINLDFFEENRSNIFMQRKTIPTQTGFMTSVWSNFGKVNNRGFDGSLNFNKHFGEFFLSLRGTFTYARNTVLEYDEPESVKNTYRSQTGIPMGTQWGLQAIGLYTEDDFDSEGNLKFGLPKPEVGATGGKVHPGDIKYKDMDGDGYITNADEGYIGGTYDPEIVYGLGANMAYKGFDLGIFFQGTGNTHQIIGGNAFFIPGSGQGLRGNLYENYQDRWTVENPSQDVFWPRLSEDPNQHNYRASSWWLVDRSFLRLKTLELGYSLPDKVLKRAYIKGLRFYVSGNNLFYISNFRMWDPELNSNNGLRYPPMRSFLFGLDITF